MQTARHDIIHALIIGRDASENLLGGGVRDGGHHGVTVSCAPPSLKSQLLPFVAIMCRDEAWARSSAGEHYVDIVGVAGSIPAAPTVVAKATQKD